MTMGKEYYENEYERCSNRLKVLECKRIEKLNKIPPELDLDITKEIVNLTYKMGLIKGAIAASGDNIWSIHDHLIYLFDQGYSDTHNEDSYYMEEY